MNYSIYSADRATHLRIVVLSLIAAIAIILLNLSCRGGPDSAAPRSAEVVRPGAMVAMTSTDVVAVR